MDIEHFRRYFMESQPALEAWGKVVTSTINTCAEATSARIQFTSQRLKALPSALGKIARKTYTDPINEMDDLVGVRVVVLLSEDLEKVVQSVECADKWIYDKARDPDAEVARDPNRFDYRSVHYVLSTHQDLDVEGCQVPRGTRCELQVRTILQHAYAEVTHDNVYKSPWSTPTKAARYLASSSALIETTEHLFGETMGILEEESRARGQFLDDLAGIYLDRIGKQGGFDRLLNMAVLEQFKDHIPDDAHACLDSFMDGHQFIATRVKARLPNHPFWHQPISLLTYWLVEREPEVVYRNWPFAGSHEPLELVYSDMGVAPRH